MGLLNDVSRMKFDVRLIDWNLKHGQVTKDEVQKHQGALPDEAANALPLELNDNDDDALSDPRH